MSELERDAGGRRPWPRDRSVSNVSALAEAELDLAADEWLPWLASFRREVGSERRREPPSL